MAATVANKARKEIDAALRAARADAEKMVQGKGRRNVRALLRKAELELNQRLAALDAAGADKDAFTSQRTSATLLQVQAVLADLSKGMKGALIDNAKTAAKKSAEGVISQLEDLDKLYRGIGVQPLALDQARLFDRAIMGAESSVLHRLSGSAEGGGILQRYGTAVIENFEERLQLAAITREPWADTRNALIKESPFLQGAPAHWAERIVRTETMAALNRGTFEATRQANDELGDVVKILCATFDNRTGADSYAVHGQIRRPEEAFQWWEGLYQHPPNRPNDREIVVMHRIAWPIPAELSPRSDGEVAARWRAQGRKGSPPPRPKMTTVDLALFGKGESEPERTRR